MNSSGVVLVAVIVGCLAAVGALGAVIVLLRRSASLQQGTDTGLASDGRTGVTSAGVTSARVAGAGLASAGATSIPAGRVARAGARDAGTRDPSAEYAGAEYASAGDASTGDASTGDASTGDDSAGEASGAAARAAKARTGPVAAVAADSIARSRRAGRAELDEAEIARLAAEADAFAAELRAKAERDAADIITRAENAATDSRRETEAEARASKEEARQVRADLERREDRLGKREQRLDELARKAEDRAAELDKRQAELSRLDADRQAEVLRLQAARDAELSRLQADRHAELERVAGLTTEQAKGELVAAIENQAKRDAIRIVRDIEAEARREGVKRARKIVTLAIQRIATEQTNESVVSVLHLPGDEMKGRIIGREGRNIRAFESVTGVNLIIDDTPEAVLLSCFDPVRREVGRLTLERLVLDGRIHPQRIEESYERSTTEIEALCVRAGEDALAELGITDMHPELTNLLGRLRYRTSYGQNVLKHLVESGHLAGIMASELGMDPVLLRRCALLHDIGKALTHEVQGSHALIGAEIARKYAESEDVVHAIEAHHNEVEVRTVEAVLTQAADAISGGRPGARRESLEAYVTRLERLEAIARAQDGVEKVFAMQAGREIRVMVKPGDIDDIQAQVIAREVAKRIQDELTYPGQIRVTVIRESRATEFAR